MPALPSLRPSRPHLRRSRRGPSVPTRTHDAVVDCGVYRDGARDGGHRDPAEALGAVRAGGEGFVWLGLHSPDGAIMTEVAETFGLHELTVEDALDAGQRPKLERYDQNLVTVMRTVAYVPHESMATAEEIVAIGEVMVLLGPDFVITVRHGDHFPLTDVRARLEADADQLALGPAAVLHAVADAVVDRYVEVTDSVETDIDTLEEQIFSPRTAIEIEPIYLLKREVVEMRRAIEPLGAPLAKLIASDSALLGTEMRRYFRDVADHHAEVSDRISSYDGVLTALVDAALGKLSVQQNNDMRKIAAYAAIITVPTFIAGLYGMNFETMPELTWNYGYPTALLVMVVMCAFLWRGFRRNGWL